MDVQENKQNIERDIFCNLDRFLVVRCGGMYHMQKRNFKAPFVSDEPFTNVYLLTYPVTMRHRESPTPLRILCLMRMHKNTDDSP